MVRDASAPPDAPADTDAAPWTRPHRMQNPVKEYAWGSRTAIARLLGGAAATPRPQAELWMGAHPTASSVIQPDGRDAALIGLFEEQPAAWLGAAVTARFGRLPFLLKVLAAERPLSLQAHPSSEQARRGFEDEEARRVPIQAPHRLYRDPFHKPELLCAVGPFEALCGFRDPAATRELFAELEVPGLGAAITALGQTAPASALRGAFEALNMLDAQARAALAHAVTRACQRDAAASSPFARELAWGARLGTAYPGDIGVAVALMLNLLRLEAWEGVYLPAGELHAYLEGVGIEIMASSDNVLRGGLTEKHVDVAALTATLTFQPSSPGPVATSPGAPGEQVYDSPAPEFRLSRVSLEPGRLFTPLERTGPEVLLCWDGSAFVESDGKEALALPRGGSAFVPAAAAYRVRGEGTLFRAAVR